MYLEFFKNKYSHKAYTAIDWYTQYEQQPRQPEDYIFKRKMSAVCE